uniref:Uncharacterized protein n=1 Tax=Meloidogyne floridensis TaxID=298350 RepID=A0A915NK86_9BILA
MGWKFILLSTVLIISLSCANGDNTLQIGLSSTSNSVIDTAADAIATASSATGDILLSLKNVGLKSSLFLKVIVPIGTKIFGIPRTYAIETKNGKHLEQQQTRH